MDRLDFKSGGQPFYNRDFKFQFSQLFKSVEKQYEEQGAFVLSGCQVSESAISSGLVYIGGKIMEFEGVVGVSFPVYLKQATPIQHEERFFAEDNANKTTRVNYHAKVTSIEPINEEYIEIRSDGAKRFLQTLIVEHTTQVSLSNPAFNGPLTYRKLGAMVEVSFDIAYTDVPGYNHLVYGLPIGYRPVSRIFTPCTLFDGGFAPGTVAVNTDGSIAVYDQRKVGERTIATLYFAYQ